MSAIVLPDAVLASINLLKSRNEITDLVDERIYSRVPPQNTEWPLVVLTRIGGIPTTPEWIDKAHIQIDAWGEDEPNASLIARTIQAVLIDSRNTIDETAESVLCDVEPLIGWRVIDDETTGRARYSADFRITIHPAPVTGS